MALSAAQANNLRSRGINTVGTTDPAEVQGGFVQSTGGKITSTQSPGWREAMLAKCPSGKFNGA